MRPFAEMQRPSMPKVARRAIVHCVGVTVLLLTAAQIARAEDDHVISFSERDIGAVPAEFEVLQLRNGAQARWSVVHDPSAEERAALEQSSRDLSDNVHPMAIYRSVSLKNVAARVQFKIVSGRMKNAGLALRYQNRNNYYAVVASALEQRVDLICAVDGKVQRIAGVDAEVAIDHWQEIGVIADGARFAVVLDGAELFIAFDNTFGTGGRIALWTEEDNVTRFGQFAIKALPGSEER